MNRKRIVLVLLVALLLTACGGRDTTPVEEGVGPGRLIRRIDVALHPLDPNFTRTYVTQENMNELLSLLRNMETDKYPDWEPDLLDGQSYYSATVTYANGDQTVYYLLGHTYLRLGDNPWCLVDRDQSKQFVEFIRSHPTDDGSVTIETTAAPTETTAPAE